MKPLLFTLFLIFLALSAQADESCERPAHRADHDRHLLWDVGHVAPYSCVHVEDESEVDIEHIVSFKEAVESGLDCYRAKEFVNDELNLTVALPHVNRHQKIDKDAAEWLPEHNKCFFADRTERTKAKYGLSKDPAEQEVLDSILENCSDEERKRIVCPEDDDDVNKGFSGKSRARKSG